MLGEISEHGDDASVASKNRTRSPKGCRLKRKPAAWAPAAAAASHARSSDFTSLAVLPMALVRFYTAAMVQREEAIEYGKLSQLFMLQPPALGERSHWPMRRAGAEST